MVENQLSLNCRLKQFFMKSNGFHKLIRRNGWELVRVAGTMYPGSSFERVETIKTTKTVGNRIHVYRSSCKNCWGTGKVVCKTSLPLEQ